MRRHGCEFAEILHALTFINQRRCLPPLKALELQGISRGVLRYRPAA
jgi:hypothetical protein